MLAEAVPPLGCLCLGFLLAGAPAAQTWKGSSWGLWEGGQPVSPKQGYRALS